MVNHWWWMSLCIIKAHTISFFWSALRINEFGEFWSFSRKFHCNKIAHTISMENISAFFFFVYLKNSKKKKCNLTLVQSSRQNDISHEICFVMTQHILYIGSSDSVANWIFCLPLENSILDFLSAWNLCAKACNAFCSYVYIYMLTIILIMSFMGICKLCICNITTWKSFILHFT